MKQAVVFFDVDGTLISDETGRIPNSTREALERLRANGHIPVVNTGRPYSHVVPPVKALPIRDYVCSCGQFILMDGKILQDAKPPKAVCEKIRDLVIDCRADCIFEGSDVVYWVDGNVLTFNFQQGVNRGNGSPVFRQDVMEPAFHFDKFSFWHNEKTDYGRFAAEAEEFFTPIIRSPNFTEYVLRGHSKGIGIRTYLDSLPKGERTVYAFGDSPNDMEMFRQADVNVLMGNGNRELRSMVDYVTDTVDNDGIFKALEHFALI